MKQKPHLTADEPPEESAVILYGYDDGLGFDYKNPYKPYSLYWQWYMRGYIQGVIEIRFEEA